MLPGVLLVSGFRAYPVEMEAERTFFRLRLSGYIQALEDHHIPYELINVSENQLQILDFDAILDPGCTWLHNAPGNKKIWLARFDQADETEKELYRTLIARQDKKTLGLNAVTLIKEIMRSGHTPERSVLISPEII